MDDFIQDVRNASRTIAPDYPGIQGDLDPHEHLWAITSSYEGTSLANEDCHQYIKFLLKQLGWTPLEGLDRYKMRENRVPSPAVDEM